MMRLFKKRQEGPFRDGQETKFRTLLRNWLNWPGAGIGRACRTAKNPQNSACGRNQATKPVQSVSRSESGFIAPKSPGDIALYLLFKKRSAQSLSDRLKPVGSGRSRSEPDGGKAVQE